MPLILDTSPSGWSVSLVKVDGVLYYKNTHECGHSFRIVKFNGDKWAGGEFRKLHEKECSGKIN